MTASRSKRPSVLGAVLKDWTARVGPTAAAHRVRYYRTVIWAWLSSMFGLVLVLVGAFNGLLGVTLVGVAGLVGSGVFYVVSFLELRKMNAAIRLQLGVEFGFFGGPPSRQDAYQRWCKRRQVPPYPCRDEQPPDVRTKWF